MSLIPERLWELMTPEERENAEAVLDGWRHSPVATCPGCGAQIAVRIKVTAGAVFLDKRLRDEAPKTTLPGGKPNVDTGQSSVDRRVIEAAQSSGVLEAFAAAVKTEKEHSGIPSNMGEFFLLFWRGAQPSKVSAVVLAAWIEEFGGHIDVWQSNGIIAVLSDGQLMTFFPNRLTLPVTISGKGPRPKISNTQSFEIWRRGRFGYVPVSARGFGEALQKKSIGAFGALVQ